MIIIASDIEMCFIYNSHEHPRGKKSIKYGLRIIKEENKDIWKDGLAKGHHIENLQIISQNMIKKSDNLEED